MPGFGSKPKRADDLNIHHAVERWIQRYKLGLDGDYNDVPGYLIPGSKHTWGYGPPHSDTLSGKLKAAIDPLDGSDKLLITTKIRDVYINEGLTDLWAVTKMWLDAKGIPTPI